MKICLYCKYFTGRVQRDTKGCLISEGEIAGECTLHSKWTEYDNSCEGFKYDDSCYEYKNNENIHNQD